MKFLLVSIGTCLAVASILFADNESSSALTVAQRLALWRTHIVTQGNYGGIETDHEQYRALVKMGPNCLAEVFAVYARETDAHVLYYQEMLIRRIAHFDFFEYAREPVAGTTYDLRVEPEEEIPFLSERVGREEVPYPERLFLKQHKLMAWWQQRKAFLARTDVEQRIRALVRPPQGEFRFAGAQARAFCRLSVYGIYNLPYLIDYIAANNDGVMFSEFLRLANDPQFQELEMTYDKAANGRKAAAAYPTVQDKLARIAQWWHRQESTYRDLSDLHAALAERIGKYGTTPAE